MTITSTGPSGFHLKPLVSVFAVAAIAAGILAIIQVTGTDSPLSTPAPAEVSTDVVEPYSGPSGLSQALADGKLDELVVSLGSGPNADTGRVLCVAPPWSGRRWRGRSIRATPTRMHHSGGLCETDTRSAAGTSAAGGVL